MSGRHNDTIAFSLTANNRDSIKLNEFSEMAKGEIILYRNGYLRKTRKLGTGMKLLHCNLLLLFTTLASTSFWL